MTNIAIINANHRPVPASAQPSTDALRFMEGVAAACALMAHADGEVAQAERRRIVGLLCEMPTLKGFSRDQIVDEMAVHEANFRLDPEVAQLMAREKLEPLRDDRRLAQRAIAVCRELIAADGVAHPSEYRVLHEITAYLKNEAMPAPTKRRRYSSWI